MWVGPTGGSDIAPAGNYMYTLTFDLSGLDPATAVISGQWSSDNQSVIILNGINTTFTSPFAGFGVLHSFLINEGFLPGINMLQFLVTNPQIPPGDPNPTGLLVQNLQGHAVVKAKVRPSKPLKWSQPPIEIDPNANVPIYCGWDEPSFTEDPCSYWKVVADDFRCLGTMPVTSVHWWGSYVGWEGPEPPQPEPIAWRIGFWSNVPADVAAEYSYPEELLRQVEVPADCVRGQWAGYDKSPDPCLPWDTCFEYYVDLEPNQYFWQADFNANTIDSIFWISITAIYPNDVNDVEFPWGWKTRPWSWMDDAVRFELYQAPQLGTVLDPCDVTPIEYDRESYDVAFELDTDPDYIKWEQPFEGIRHWPHYEDELSMAEADPCDPLNITRLAADDWRCDANTPITAAVWWGSYIGYRYQPCAGPGLRPVKPDYFLLNFWGDVPADDPCNLYPYSHPNDVIWEYRAYDYDEVLVGYDKHPHDQNGPPREPVFRYSVKFPCEQWFFQDTNDGIYWFSVVAVYDQNDPDYNWGWTNHRHTFNDDAVAGVADTNGAWVWQELFDQTGASEDMSFVLFTDPDPNLGTCWDMCQCPCQPQGDCTCNGQVNLADLFCLKAHFGKSAPWVDPECCADFTQSGSINLADLFALKAGFGLPCPAGSTGNQKCP
jgi:hypothetical protein